MKFIGIIPARYASSRFPGKPLVDIAGKTMIQRVYEQAQKSSMLDTVVVATDDDKIYNHVISFGGKVVMTNSEHRSGTDRCFEAMEKLKSDFDVIINIQGDEPFIDPQTIDMLAESFNDTNTKIGTLICRLVDKKLIQSNNTVKVVVDKNYNALYFSRFPIPFLRNIDLEEWLKDNEYFQHLGIYGYRYEALKKIVELKPSKLEVAESLEQLRWLEAGFQIKTCLTQHAIHGIDTPSDLEYALSILKNQ